MKDIVIFTITAVALLAAAALIVYQVCRIWRERKRRREEKLAEKIRRSEIRDGAVSEDFSRQLIAFQAAMLHANSYFAETFATMIVGLQCLFLAALLQLLGPKLMEFLIVELLLIGLVILGISVVGLIDFKFFQRDLSGEYRSLLAIQETDTDEGQNQPEQEV
jgi:hypothetical protein